MTVETRPTVAPSDATANLKPMRDRATEEPRGRWDNRCSFTRSYGSGQEMVCDRRDAHRGLHHGRLFKGIGWTGGTQVIGWVTVLR